MGYTEDRLAEVAEKLLRATERNTLNWRTTNTQTAFQTVRSKSSAIIESVEGDGSAPHSLTIFNEDGVAVESLSSSWDDQGLPEHWNDFLESLYEAARRRALNIDSVISDLLGDLDEGGF